MKHFSGSKTRHVLRMLGVLLMAQSLAGCGLLRWYTGGEDNTEPPAELKPLAGEVSVQELWRVASGADSREQFVHLQPALSPSALHIAGFNGRVVGLDSTTGARKWSVETDTLLSGGVGFGQGLVLVASPEGEVIALESASGKEVWRSRVGSEVLSPPQAASGIAVVRTVDGRLQGLDSADGERRWTLSRTMPSLTLRGTGAPVLVPGAAIAGLDNGKVIVIDTNSGRVFWERTIAPPTGRSELERMVDIDSAPRLAGKIMYLVAFQGKVVAMEVETGRILWSRDLSSYTGLDVDSRAVFVTDADGVIWAMDRRSGASLWRQDELRNRLLTRPVVFGDHIVVGDLEGYLHWIARADGRVRARSRIADDRIAVAPVATDDTLYAVDVAGTAVAFRGP